MSQDIFDAPCRECPDGANCKDIECGFEHPETWQLTAEWRLPRYMGTDASLSDACREADKRAEMFSPLLPLVTWEELVKWLVDHPSPDHQSRATKMLAAFDIRRKV